MQYRGVNELRELFLSFFEEKGFKDAEYYVVDGRMPCAIAVITKK